MPGEKTPERPEGGGKIHERQLQELHDWMKRERLLPGPGIIETPEGKRFQPKDYERLPQFHPTIFYGDQTPLTGIANPYDRDANSPQGFAAHGHSSKTKLAIKTGYVYAPHFGSDASGINHQANPTINQWAYEPQMSGTYLSSDTPPTLELTNLSGNYIYLKVTWSVMNYRGGGATWDTSEYAFKAHHRLHVEGQTDTASGGSGEGSYDSHSHNLSESNAGGTAGNMVADGNPKTITGYPEESGILVPITQRKYIYSASEFVVQTDEAPPTETETTTYIPAGYIYLNSMGLIEGWESNPTNFHNGFRWFLEGPIWAQREGILLSPYTDVQDSEPPTIVAAADVHRPGVQPEVGA